jgi:hypothetical protein
MVIVMVIIRARIYMHLHVCTKYMHVYGGLKCPRFISHRILTPNFILHILHILCIFNKLTILIYSKFCNRLG